jgi:hypothetical protein
MIFKLLITISLSGFLGVGVLLLINHPGFAIKITNYLFFVLCLGIVLTYYNNDQK